MRLMGKGRAMRRSMATDLADSAPERMRELLAPHVDGYCEQLVADVKTPTLDGQFGPVSNPAHRGAMTLFAQIMRAIGSGDMIVNALILQLGVPLEQAKAAVALVEGAPKDVHEQARKAQEFLDWYRGPNGPSMEVQGDDEG